MSIKVGSKVRMAFSGRVKKKDSDKWVKYEKGDVAEITKIKTRRKTKIYTVKLRRGGTIDVRGHHLEPLDPKKRKRVLFDADFGADDAVGVKIEGA